MWKIVLLLSALLMMVAAKPQFWQCVDNLAHINITPDCVKLVIAKILGVGIIVGSFSYKVPQIIKVVGAKSGKGVTLFSTYAETLIFINMTLFGIHNNFPFTAYGEAITILIQNAILLILLWQYHPKGLTHPPHIAAAGFFIAYSFWMHSGIFFPEVLWDFVMQLNIVLSIMGRSDIIKTNYENKSTGELSFITAFLGFGGTLSRVFTSIVQTDSLQLLISCIVSFILATIIMIQFGLYWNEGSGRKVQDTPSAKKPTSGRRSIKKVE